MNYMYVCVYPLYLLSTFMCIVYVLCACEYMCCVRIARVLYTSLIRVVYVICIRVGMASINTCVSIPIVYTVHCLLCRSEVRALLRAWGCGERVRHELASARYCWRARLALHLARHGSQDGQWYRTVTFRPVIQDGHRTVSDTLRSQDCQLYWTGTGRSHNDHTTITGRSQDGHRTITGRSQDGHRTVTGRSQDGHRRVTGRSQDGHRTITGRSQNGCMAVTERSVQGSQLQLE